MEIGDKNAAIPVAGSAARQAFFEKYFARQQSCRDALTRRGPGG
jgi:hypothetical protein